MKRYLQEIFFHRFVERYIERRLTEIKESAQKGSLTQEEKVFLMYGMLIQRFLLGKSQFAKVFHGIADEEKVANEFSDRFLAYYERRRKIVGGLDEAEDMLWEGLLEKAHKGDK